ncbi:hypothetical protein KAX06_09755 [candidate division WOR-3 bacterium]|nr:hypothetical protein [candidate division WOR-3 bacterium]
MVEKLKRLLADLKALRKDLKAEKVTQIAKKHLRTSAEDLGSRWFSDFSSTIPQELGLSTDVLGKYSDGFGRLIALSSPNNLKKSYVEVLDALIKPFRDELILPAQKGGSSSASLALLHNILKDLPDPEENEYLKEGISCAQRGFLRASVVLGWCAAIDRIHRRIEDVGFTKFNVTSVQMAGQQKGRFKRFSSPQNVNSLSELREVFDTVSLWIIEGMGMIDSNQHTRLRSCFDLRCHCGHPGEAPVTEYNLMSFYSDINQIIFRNPMFKI